MKLVGFDFKKISIERFKDSAESLKFNTKLDISSISSLKSDILKTREELLKIEFIYSVLYEPDFAKLELAGKIILAVEPRIAREVLKGWKDKETSEEFRIFMFNIILRKSNIKALQLEEELGLPSHIPLPSVNKENMKEQKEQK
jgi:hypothetical protein